MGQPAARGGCWIRSGLGKLRRTGDDESPSVATPEVFRGCRTGHSTSAPSSRPSNPLRAVATRADGVVSGNVPARGMLNGRRARGQHCNRHCERFHVHRASAICVGNVRCVESAKARSGAVRAARRHVALLELVEHPCQAFGVSPCGEPIRDVFR